MQAAAGASQATNDTFDDFVDELGEHVSELDAEQKAIIRQRHKRLLECDRDGHGNGSACKSRAREVFTKDMAVKDSRWFLDDRKIETHGPVFEQWDRAFTKFFADKCKHDQDVDRANDFQLQCYKEGCYSDFLNFIHRAYSSAH